jgi:hypothetical protein
MKNNKSIVSKENEKACIEKLVAQKKLYSNAKVLFYIQAFISVVSLVILSFVQLVFNEIDFTLIIATLSILALFADNFLSKCIDKTKEKASKIQEYFDTYVLDIKWNQILCGDRPEHDEICYYYHQYIRNHDLSKFQNWYEPEIDLVPIIAGKIICQKTNCTYDSKIRKKFNNAIIAIYIITIVLISLFTVFSDIYLSKIILTLIFPSIPIIQWTYNNVSTNNDSINNLEQLNRLINATWEDVKNGKTIEENTIRQIQDGIFLNRKESVLIPDFVYNCLRNKLERNTHYSVSQLVNDFANNN